MEIKNRIPYYKVFLVMISFMEWPYLCQTARTEFLEAGKKTPAGNTGVFLSMKTCPLHKQKQVNMQWVCIRS